jgi:hypothetical protein
MAGNRTMQEQLSRNKVAGNNRFILVAPAAPLKQLKICVQRPCSEKSFK